MEANVGGEPNSPYSSAVRVVDHADNCDLRDCRAAQVTNPERGWRDLPGLWTMFFEPHAIFVRNLSDWIASERGDCQESTGQSVGWSAGIVERFEAR